jgi:hypothetical protein
MEDASAQLSEIAQQLAALAAAARELADQPLFEPSFPANENRPPIVLRETEGDAEGSTSAPVDEIRLLSGN